MLSALLKLMRNVLHRRETNSQVSLMRDQDIPELKLAAADFAAGRLVPAKERYRALMCKYPDEMGILFPLGVIYGGSGMLNEAEAVLAHAERIDPRSVDVRNARANVAWLGSAWEEAERRFKAALDLAPGNATIWANFGLCLHDAGKLAEASVAVAHALEIEPAHPDALVNAALVQMDLGDVDGSRAYLQRALEAAPEFAEAHSLRAQLLLRDGDFAEGWREYEWRIRCSGTRYRELAGLPDWDGATDRNGRLVILGEQGLGDQIMFASCLPEVLLRVARCEVECDTRLLELFSRSFPGIRFHPQQEDLARPWAEVISREGGSQIHLGSLPKLFRGDAGRFPRHQGYLKPDSTKSAYWSGQLAALGDGLKVGIAWRGGVPRTRQSMRSIPLCEWAPLLQCDGVHFVSLQHGRHEDELAETSRAGAAPVARWRRAIDNCEEMAALIAGLDLVITVCGTVVHLAGAVGRPVWVLVPTCPEWRYFGAGDTMPWYPAVKLFRQKSMGDWGATMAEVSQRLSAMVRAAVKQNSDRAK